MTEHLHYITYAHPDCFHCQGWAREAETEANRHPNAKAAQVGDYHHWARYYKDTTQAPAHGGAPSESETEMTKTTTLKPGQTWRNHLDVELHIMSNAAECFRTVGSDIWVAERRDPLFGSTQYIVTAAALAEAGYKEVTA